MSDIELQGLMPILATPFHPNGALDEDSLRHLVAFQLSAGADGIGLFGFASESFTLTHEERIRIMQVVTDASAGSVPIVAGISAGALQPALEQGRALVDLGADALMVLPPHPVGSDRGQLFDYFEALTDLGAPIMIQDAPRMTGVSLPATFIAELSAIVGVEYVKIEEQPTAEKVAALSALSAPIRVFAGQNAFFVLDEFERGAIGVMPACEFTDALAHVLTLHWAQQMEAARDAFRNLLPLIRYGLQPGIAWAIHKEVLVTRRIIASSRVRAPAKPLSAEAEAGLRIILEDLERWWPGAMKEIA